MRTDALVRFNAADETRQTLAGQMPVNDTGEQTAGVRWSEIRKNVASQTHHRQQIGP